ncbi:sodium:solute symporter family protein [Nannocystis sp.]|uniref:sodium:solute symporter family protein n=1 Tax=Nannocystis sp. TaxID=1962667 RepID=UPI0024256E3B|nr:sodium:solute symporter family protein [Nannocystis sp.]MBK7826441.1 sodium:solute symporter family protein [Nannocystis sp.]MBK9757958.1 sodium:solute symporter family protein [Nannocystis sp.]
MASALVFGYLAFALVLGIWAGRRGSGGSDDFITGERSFGPVLMYFVMGAMVFSAYALLGTPQRVMAKGSDAFYALAYGAVAFVPIFFFGAKVRRIGAREGLVTQAEFLGARFASRRLTAIMGLASLLACVPYIVIQFKGAGVVMQQVLGWHPIAGAALVYAVVTLYVMFGGMRGVGWTNVLQGVVMLVVVWWLGLAIPEQLFGGVSAMFDRVVAERPEYLTLPGPAPGTSDGQWSAEVLLSILGFTMWPQVFMKCFTARSARLVQHSAVVYPTFLLFLVPLFFLGYAALLLPGAPRDERVLLWLVSHPQLANGELMAACFSLAVLAASMSTGDALLHGGSSIFVRDVVMKGAGVQLSERAQTWTLRATVVVLGVLGLWMTSLAGSWSLVDLLLLAYAVPVQFLPITLLGLYWRRANRVAAEVGLGLGLGCVIALFAASKLAPGLYAAINPQDLQIGVLGLAVNLAAMLALSLLTPPMAKSHLQRFELE